MPQFSYFNHFLAGITTGFFIWLTILAVDLPRCLKSSLYFFYSWDYCSHHTQQLLFNSSLLHFSVATNTSAFLFTRLNPVSHLKETKICAHSASKSNINSHAHKTEELLIQIHLTLSKSVSRLITYDLIECIKTHKPKTKEKNIKISIAIWKMAIYITFSLYLQQRLLLRLG